MSGSAPEGAPYRSLTGQKAFDKVYEAGEIVRTRGVVVRALAGEPGLPAVGVVAGKRVGGAVARNRAKRRLRAALCEVQLAADTVYVVTAAAGIEEVGYKELVGRLQRAVAKLARAHGKERIGEA